MPNNKKFGFYPYDKSFDATDIKITPLDDIEHSINEVLWENRIYDGWYYPPIVRHRSPRNSLIAPLKPTAVPDTPTDIFQLPTTHMLFHVRDVSDEHLHFLVLSFGLLIGMRLLPEPWRHFYRTPVEEHKLSDLIVGRSDVIFCLAQFDKFYIDAAPELRAVVWSAINTFQMAQSYEHQFEEFFFQYVTLDTIFRAFRISQKIATDGRHRDRPKRICEVLEVVLPSWAVLNSDGSCELSKIRNEIFHSGAVNGTPLGFGVIRPTSILLEMTALNMRALLALLGIDTPYVHSEITSRQMHGLR